MKHVGIDWQINDMTGWGNMAIHLSTAMLRIGSAWPVIMPGFKTQIIDASVKTVMQPVLAYSEQSSEGYEPTEGMTAQADFPLLVSMGNRGTVCSTAFLGEPSIGLCYSEDTDILIEGSDHLDKVLAGNHWALGVLRAAGLKHVDLWQQGIDETIFYPMPSSRNYADRFVVYIGGQLSFRKGQDIAIAAFKIFHERHPDALLMAAVDSCWPEWAIDLTLAGHMKGDPVDGQVLPWLHDNGLVPGSYRVVGLMPHNLTPLIYRDANVALFTNRCEASTNMVAMECIAMGIPVILSDNTGHKDLPGHKLRRQTKPPSSGMYEGQEGWGESDIEEVLEALEKAYTGHTYIPDPGDFADEWNWTKRTKELLEHIDA